MNELIVKYAEEITNKLKDNLEALILVGSFSRGEGIEGLSDIEYWAVVKNIASVSMPDLKNEKITLNSTTRNHLSKLKPYIFAVEVKKFGKVLWGDKEVLDLIPNYDFKDIEPFDGFVLLNNRIVEQLILWNKIQEKKEVHAYDFDKGCLDRW